MVSGIVEHKWAMRALFENDGIARASRPLSFSPHGGKRGIEPRIPPLKKPFGRRHVKPLHASPAGKSDPAEFINGCRILGFEPSDHQLRYAAIMDAVDDAGMPRHRRTAKTEPRRSGKTDGMLAHAIGRCVAHEDYYVAFSAQSGKKGRDRFLKAAVKIERYDPCPRSSRSNPDGCQREHVHYRIYRSNGGERIEWLNGSVFMVLPPDPEAYRGEEYHLILLDEGQEMSDPDTAEEMLGGVNPTMDTVLNAQLVIAGTAGKVRAGLLWDALERGRSGKWGILEYAAPDHADPEDVQTLLDCHPGIGVLTTLDIVQGNRDDESMTLVQFQREYLGQWPPDLSTSAIDTAAWKASAVAPVARPARVGLAFDVAPDGSSASLCCAWRDRDGVAHIEVLAHRAGTQWLPGAAARVHRSSRARVAYDVVGQNVAPAQAMTAGVLLTDEAGKPQLVNGKRLRVTVRLDARGMKDMQGAAQLLVTELNAGTLRHFGQDDLDAAAEGAAWRNTQGETARLFGHKASAHAITPLTGAALALWNYDKSSRRRTARPASSADVND